MKEVNWFKYLLAVVTAAALPGCGNKPPECSDQAAVTALQQLLHEKALESATMQGVKLDDDQATIQKYLSSWAFAATNISTIGYHEASRTRSCQAKATLTLPDAKSPGVVDVAYELQKFEDSKADAFELRADQAFVRLAYTAGPFIKNYVGARRIQGAWQGTTACTPTEVTLSQSGRPLPSEESAAGLTLLNSRPPWIDDGPGTALPVALVINDGTVTMTIQRPDGAPVVRSKKMGEKSFNFQQLDEVSSVVLRGGIYHEGKWLTEGDSHIVAEAKVKSNASGNEHYVFLKRRCTLELASK